MKSKNAISGFSIGLGAVLALAAGAAYADVTTEQRISVQGVGIMAVANMSGTLRMAISGNKSRSDSDLQLESKIVRFLARNAVGPSAEIVLLDADKLYTLNINRKEYTEQSFEEFRTRMQNAMNGANKGTEKPPEQTQPSAVDQSKCEWLEPKSDVRKTGEKATVAGVDAERYIISAEQPCKDKETGAICEIALTLDEWMAPKFVTNEEVQKYRKAYAEKLGVDKALGQDASDRAKVLFSQYKGTWAQIVAKMKDVKGYPVRSSFALAVGGDQCKSAQSAQPSGSSTASASGGGSSSSASSSAPSASDSTAELASKAVSKLGSLFHKKKDESAPPAQTDQGTQAAASTPAAAPATGPSGTVTLLTISSELVSVSTSSIDPGSFGVPSGFKKVEQKAAT